MSKVFKSGLIVVLLLGPVLGLGVPAGHAKLRFKEAPQLIENPSGRVPLAAVINFASNKQLDSHLVITDGDNSWEAVFGPEIASDGKYAIPVAGMRPDREHTIRLTLKENGKKRHRQTFVHRTPGLPPSQLEFPNFDIQVAEIDKMEPGVTFLSVRRRAPGRAHWWTENQKAFSTQWGMLVAIDNAGEVIWWYESDARTSGIDRLSNGNILMHRANSSTLEVDLLGNIVGEYYAELRPFPPSDNPNAVAIKGLQTLHHQPHQMPNGDFLAFSANAYPIENWYTSETDPDAPRADGMIMADTVVQINPQGEQVWTWNVLDYLDTERIGRDTFWSYWWTRGFDQHWDWSHANGLSYYEPDDSVLVSFRNQSAIVKIDRKTGEIKWILGNHRNWPNRLQDKLLEPVGELLWPAYQHNPRMTHAGTVIMFDNRSYGGALAFEETLPVYKSFSRGVEFEVDEQNMSVRQVWSSGDEQGEDPCFTNAMSDAWRLPKTDNRLVIHAFCIPLDPRLTEDVMDESKRAADEIAYGGRILEFAGEEVVFRAEVKDPDDLIQWEVYGGFRSPGIYQKPGESHH